MKTILKKSDSPVADSPVAVDIQHIRSKQVCFAEGQLKLRRGAREMALRVLFAQEFHHLPDSQKAGGGELANTQKNHRLLAHHLAFTGGTQKKVENYCMQILTGIVEKREQIDTMIAQTSPSWKLSRMPLVDLNIMRIAVFEMLFGTPSVPFKVCINEAVEMAKLYGTSDSFGFVNGVLDAVFQKTLTPYQNSHEDSSKDNSKDSHKDDNNKCDKK